MRIFKSLFLTVMVIALFHVSSVCAAGSPIVLRFSSYLAPTHHMQVSFQWVADEIVKRANGRVQIKMYHSGSLHSAKQGFEAIRNNISDVTIAYPQYDPTGFHLGLGGALPMKFRNAKIACRVMEELYPEFLKEEYEATGVMLGYWGMSVPYTFVATKKPVKTLQDLQGMKFRSSGGLHTDALKAIGAVPVMLPTPEIYSSIERGVIDGAFYTAVSGMSYHLYEVGKYISDVGIVSMDLPIAMNPKTYRKLPPEVQDIMYQVFREGGMHHCAGFDDGNEKGLKEWVAMGGQVVQTDKSEKEKIRRKVQILEENWITNCAKVGKGEKAKAMLKKMDELIRKYDKMPDEQLIKEHIETAELKKLW